jgi:dienelactone hydrolase
VEQTEYGWFFDGPSEDTALVFYPGGKVEETAYAPLLHRIVAEGTDVCLAKMPFHLAVLDKDAAKDIMEQHNYRKWYIGGHSLGGVMAADFAVRRSDRFIGVILLAAYPVKEIPSKLSELLLVGSRDQVINMNKVVEGRQNAPDRYEEYVIEGGNHAQFGSYGRQKGDGIPSISPEQQVQESVGYITDYINRTAE